jgi:hypothetical protein
MNLLSYFAFPKPIYGNVIETINFLQVLKFQKLERFSMDIQIVRISPL